MAGETQLDTTGRKSEVWVEDSPGAGTYTRLHRVKSFGHPKSTRDQLDSTSLEDDAPTYVPDDIKFDNFSIVTNYRAGSDTDLKLEAMAASEQPYGVILIRAERGVLKRQFSFDMYVNSYGPDDAERKTVTVATADCQANGTVTGAAYTTPPPVAP
jgi:hypothetical protein